MTKDKARALTTREQCRDKISVWYGSEDNYLHGLKEVVANGVDNVINNFNDGEMSVVLDDDMRTMNVADTGTGIPFEDIVLDSEGREKKRYEILFENLFGGTNYDNNENGKIATGTNGCGTCVLNHTSDLFIVASSREGECKQLVYKDGGVFDSLELSHKTKAHGTRVTFKLSEEVYTNTVYNVDDVKAFLDRIAGCVPNMDFIFTHNGERIVLRYDGIKDYFEKKALGLNSDILMENSKEYSENDEKNTVSLVIASSTEEEPLQYTYLNNTYLQDNGTIYDGVISGAKTFFNKYMQSNNMYEKSEGKIRDRDIVSALAFICTIDSTNVSYSNQTKFSTEKKLYKKISAEYVQECLDIFEQECPMEIKKIANQILVNKRASEKTSEYMNKIKTKLTEKVSSIKNRIEGFVDCKIHGKDSMLFITEGLSALGSIILARNADVQACFPLRGKLKNILKEKDFRKVLNNEEIASLIRVMGCGIEVEKKGQDLFDKSKLRYGRVVIATDQDNDGLHIQCLVLVMIYKLMPTLIRDGHVYILKTPLFEIRNAKTEEMHYAYTDKEKDEIVSKLDKCHVNRNKGLGEVEPETMATCIDEKNGTFIKVKWEDVEQMEEWFNILMGDKLTERKEYIEKNLHKYVDIIE